MLSQMCSNGNNPEEFVTANALRLHGQLHSLQDVCPRPFGHTGDGVRSEPALSSLLEDRARLRFYHPHNAELPFAARVPHPKQQAKAVKGTYQVKGPLHGRKARCGVM